MNFTGKPSFKKLLGLLQLDYDSGTFTSERLISFCATDKMRWEYDAIVGNFQKGFGQNTIYM